MRVAFGEFKNSLVSSSDSLDELSGKFVFILSNSSLIKCTALDVMSSLSAILSILASSTPCSFEMDPRAEEIANMLERMPS